MQIINIYKKFKAFANSDNQVTKISLRKKPRRTYYNVRFALFIVHLYLNYD